MKGWNHAFEPKFFRLFFPKIMGCPLGEAFPVLGRIVKISKINNKTLTNNLSQADQTTFTKISDNYNSTLP